MPEQRHPDLDLVPDVGAETDVARLGRADSPPPHEQTSDEDADVVDWESAAALPEFRALLKAKAAFLVPTTVFFIVYYFALPVLVGWFPDLMRRRVGPVNLAYVFALSQFFMAWTVAFVYLRKAARYDEQAASILRSIEVRGEERPR
ncbi:MAG: DUF485 domain-containing protein [Candidatus Binatia bacterium]